MSSDKKNTDLTRIEDLADFLHEDNTKVDRILSKSSPPSVPNIDTSESTIDNKNLKNEADDFDDNTSLEEETSDDFSMDNEEASSDFSMDSEEASSDFSMDSEEANSDFSMDSEEASNDFSIDNEEVSDDSSENASNNLNDLFTSKEEESQITEDQFSNNNIDDNQATSTADENIDNNNHIAENESFSDDQPPNDSEEEDSIESENVKSETLIPFNYAIKNSINNNTDSSSKKEEQTPSHKHHLTNNKISKSGPEFFEDVKNFAKNISYGKIITGGNPPFGIIIKDIIYKEDADDIIRILRDFNIINQENEDVIQQSIKSGSVLISQISEYSAIILAHRLRRFQVDIQFGLAEELHKSKIYESSKRGLVTKYNIHQNKSESVNLHDSQITPESIILATTPTLQNYTILKYIDLVTEHIIVDQNQLEEIGPTNIEHSTSELEKLLQSTEEKISEEEDFLLEKYGSKLAEIYGVLANKLKEKAYKEGGNAVVGITYQITPLPSIEEKSISHLSEINLNRYKIICTGNIVWLTDQT